MKSGHKKGNEASDSSFQQGPACVWHAIDMNEALQHQRSSLQGLTDAEAKTRLEQYGKNALTPPAKPGFLRKLWEQLNNILICILLCAAIVSGILEEWAEVSLICGVIIINVTIGMIQEGKAEKAAEAIKGMLSSKATVIRNGERTVIEADQVVPGDIVYIQSGDRVPADLRMVEVTNLQVMEAMLTGESNPITKHTNPVEEKSALGDRKNLAFSATMVMSGQGKGVVVGTGDYAEIGRISAMVGSVESQKTNLMVQLEIFGRWISVFVFVIAIATFCLAKFKADEDLTQAFKSAVSIAVAIIPEGLPAVVTISLALAMQLLAKQNAIIRQLPAVETLGSCSTICSDKTGTLTKNEMTVQKIQTAKGLYGVTGVGYAPAGTLTGSNGAPLPDNHIDALRSLFEGAVLCNDASLQQQQGTHPQQQTVWTPVGYPTEVSLITLLMKMGVVDIKQLKDAKPRVASVPFASEHKFMCVVHANGPNKDSSPLYLHVKGAPDRLLPRCKDQVVDDDLLQTGPLDEQYWHDQAAQLSSLGLRVLALCRSEWDHKHVSDSMDADILLKAREPFLTMIGLIAILDPPRPEAIDAVGIAKGAGVVVKMITGDHPQTAIAIGKMLGIADPQDNNVKAYTGPEIDQMSDEQLESVVLGCNVFARASPENKIRIVKSLQNKGQICSMTGDGVNDAPALKAANIGVAMGITGTDVSKEAAKMVLADDNFATIVRAVKEGRRVWDNLVKILLYNMPVNFAQGLSVFFAYVINLEAVPLTAIQVLYVNMITSVTMGLMLAMEPAEPTIMSRPPRRSNKRLFGKMVMWHCFFVSAVLVSFVLFNFWWTLDMTPRDEVIRRSAADTSDPRMNKARAVAFNMLVFGEIAYALNCRSIRGSSVSFKMLTQNCWCWVAIAVTVALQMFLTYTPEVNTFFSNAPIDGKDWARILGFSVAVFIIVEIEKAIGPKYLMPVVRPLVGGAAACSPPVPEALAGPDMENPEAVKRFSFIATSASSVGMDHPHEHKRLRREGTNQPVDGSDMTAAVIISVDDFDKACGTGVIATIGHMPQQDGSCFEGTERNMELHA